MRAIVLAVILVLMWPLAGNAAPPSEAELNDMVGTIDREAAGIPNRAPMPAVPVPPGNPRTALFVQAYTWHWAGQRWYVSNVRVNPVGENWNFWARHWYSDIGGPSVELICPNARRGRQYTISVTWTAVRTRQQYVSNFYRTVYVPMQTERFYAPL